MRLIFALCMTACSIENNQKQTSINEEETGSAEEAVSLTGFDGEWYDCAGNLTVDEDNDRFRWLNFSNTCEVNGKLVYDGSLHTFVPDNFDSCVQPPWWISGTEFIKFRLLLGERLSMVPEEPANPGGTLQQFNRNMTREHWRLISDSNVKSIFTHCYDEQENFWGGFYEAVGESCDFLSCGGQITNIVETSDEMHWITNCRGDCPCTGVVTVEEQTTSSISGRFNGSNCSRTLEGTFTGEPWELNGSE